MITREMQSEMNELDSLFFHLLKEKDLSKIQNYLEDMVECVKVLRVYSDTNKEISNKVISRIREDMFESVDLVFGETIVRNSNEKEED